MTLKEYQQLTGRTNADLGSPAINAAHCALGIVGEIQEIFSAENDEEAIKEIGDVMWYTSELANIFNIALGVDYDEYDSNVGEAISAVAESVKKYLAYGKEINVETLKDQLCVITSFCYDQLDCYDWTDFESQSEIFEHCLDLNIEKLRKRFPEKFSAADAIAQKDMQ